MFLHCTILGNKEGLYIDPRDNVCRLTWADLASADNINDVNQLGVSALAIRRYDDGGLHIVQTSGFTPDKGLFYDLY